MSNVTPIDAAKKIDTDVINLIDLIYNLQLMQCSDEVIEAAIYGYSQLNAKHYIYTE